jgi:hypothetical protein
MKLKLQNYSIILPNENSCINFNNNNLYGLQRYDTALWTGRQGDRVRSPAEAKDSSSSLCVQTASGAHAASYPMGTWGPYPRGKARPGRDADHSPHLVPRSRKSISFTSSPWKRLHDV